MKKYVIASALLVSSVAVANPVDFEGKYACDGREPASQKSFTCEKILKKTGETYLSTTTCSDGSAITGTGIYDEASQRLSFAFINHTHQNESGVAINEIKPDGSLLITYAYMNQTQKGFVKCVKK